ncbi:MAG: MBL fold metallo-hydrolase [Trueperaceae bacterium]
MTREGPSPVALGESVWRLALPSRTLPPFDTTNTYLIVDSSVAVIVDPGFEDEGSLAALRSLALAQGARLIKAVLLTHSHNDHRAGLDLVRRTFDDPPVYIHPNELGRLEGMRVQGLSDDRNLMVGDVVVRAVHTPGHSPGHLSYYLPEEGTLLAGDLVAGSGSVWVGVPEGDMSDYLASLERVDALANLQRIGPGHGEPTAYARRLLIETRDHRLARERQIIGLLSAPLVLSDLRDAIYGDLAERLRAPAEATLLAHLRKLMAEMRVVHLGSDERGPFVVRS